MHAYLMQALTVVPLLFPIPQSEAPGAAHGVRQQQAEGKKEKGMKEDEELKQDLAKLQGKWQGFREAADGQKQRWVKEIKGHEETVTVYGEKNELLGSWVVEFRLERTGKVRIYRYKHKKILAGPDKEKAVTGGGEYIYRFIDDYLAEA